MDRFAPGEAYSFQKYIKNRNKGYNYSPPNNKFEDSLPSTSIKPPQPENQLTPLPPSVNMKYIPPKDLYSFPPNIDASYLPPSNSNNGPQTSYIPPPAGIPYDSEFPGPVNPKFLSTTSATTDDKHLSNGPINDHSQSHDHSHDNNSSNDHSHEYINSNDHDHSHEHDHNHEHDYSHEHDHSYDHDHGQHIANNEQDNDNVNQNVYLPPGRNQLYLPSAMNEPDSQSMVLTEMPSLQIPTTTVSPMVDMMMMLIDNLKSGMNPSTQQPPLPPSPYLDDHHFSPDQSFHGQYGIDVYPETIYDHDPHDHDHFHDPHEHDHVHDYIPTTMPPTPAPPPPPIESESRVKKYSYYYIGRKLWYIPLYFTLYFSFYVAALIIKSIGRHKVR